MAKFERLQQKIVAELLQHTGFGRSFAFKVDSNSHISQGPAENLIWLVFIGGKMGGAQVANSVAIIEGQGLSRGASQTATVTKMIAAACMMAASPITLAIAQQSSSAPDTLPPLVVEGARKKTAKKAQPAAPTQDAAATASPQAAPEQQPPAAKGANPYANPEAPYKVEQSASGKLSEPLVNTPRTVTTAPREVIEDKGVRDLRELARSVPGLTIGSAEGGNSYGAFAVRGFKANNDIFFDGVRNPGNLIPDVFAVQQIEIYKGPSGGIAGRSTIGGAVNIIPKQPDLGSSFYEVSTTVGTDSTFRTTIDANQKVTPDFAFRANLMYDQHDIAGRDFADSERWGGLISATARLSDSVKVTLDYYRYRNDATPDWGVPVIDAFDVPLTERGLRRSTWFGEKDLDFFKEKADIATATVTAKLVDGITLTNKSRVGKSTLDYVATSAEGLTYHHPNRDQDAYIYANQTELNVKFNTGTAHHEAVVGLELSRERIDRFAYLVTPSTAPIPVGTDGLPITDPYRNAAAITGRGKTYDANIDTIGAYLSDTVHLSKEWILNGGVRVDNFKRDQQGGPGTNPLGSAAANTAIATNTASVEDTLLSWNVGIVYKPISIASVYAAYATSQSPVGSELDSTGAQYNGISATLVDVPPQNAQSVEIGTKWELFDKRLLATAALFQTMVDHARTNDTVTTTNDFAAFAGKYRVQGIELSAAGNITKNWSVFGGLVLLDTEVLKSFNAQDVGRRLANVPLQQFSLLSRHQLTDKLAIAGSATYGGEVYGGHLAANAANNHTVDWWRFDAFAEYKLTDHMELKISGVNLTNELYYDAIYQSNDAFAFVAPGRAGYVTLKVKY